MAEKRDVIVIGASSADLAAVREIKKQTDDFVQINDGRYGSSCAQVGCMPSKALIAISQRALPWLANRLQRNPQLLAKVPLLRLAVIPMARLGGTHWLALPRASSIRLW